MSGIYGLWQPGENGIEENVKGLERWNRAYGAETESVKIQELFLGCAYEKLSETAVKSTPVLKSGEDYAVIDAVLYNREELLEKLHTQKEISDEELLWAYVKQFGYEALKDVNGDFAGAVYENGELTLFRDHMGVRPLFYYMDGKSLCFSTDIRGLVSMKHVDVSVNEQWVFEKNMCGIVLGAEATEFSHIFCVKPASYMTFRMLQGKMQAEKTAYWRIGSRKVRLKDEEAYKKQLRELITDSVQRRLNAVSGLVGAELSGGLDSSTIDILIHRLGRECVYFSWSASPEELPYAENDERHIVEDICRQESITCNYRDFKSDFDENSTISRNMEKIGHRVNLKEGVNKRYVFPPYINTLQIADAGHFVNQSGAKVVFTGHTGDEGVSHRGNPYEMFHNGEYLSYVRYMWAETVGRRFRTVKTFKKCRSNYLMARDELKKPFISPFAVEDVFKKDFFAEQDKKERPSRIFTYDPKAYIAGGGSRNRLDVVALLGAYSGVRYLVPYADYRVVDYAVSIPRRLFIKNGVNRYIFREAFKDIMPQSLYELKGKEDTSWRSLEKINAEKNKDKKPKSAEEIARTKQEALGKLDRELWGKYINFDVLDTWAACGEQDSHRDYCINMVLWNCYIFQNLVERSKAVSEVEMK